MKTATKVAARIEPKIETKGEVEWLQLLLADIQREIAEQPAAGAVDRMRDNLLAGMDPPVRAAA